MGRGPPVGGSACGSGRPLPLDLCPEPAVSGADGAGAPDVGEPLAPRDADASWGSAGGWLDADRIRDGDADSRHRARADGRVAELSGVHEWWLVCKLGCSVIKPDGLDDRPVMQFVQFYDGCDRSLKLEYIRL